MKILMVIDALSKGGKERRMLELIKGLKAEGNDFDIYLISLTDKVEYKYVYDLPIKFEIIKRKSKKDLSVIFKLNKIINDFQPDIIHSWSTMASVYLSAANFFTKKPLINAVLADAHPNLSKADKHYVRVKLTTPFSDVFVANSEAAIKSYKSPRGKSILIYNGIDFARFDNLRQTHDVELEILGSPKMDRIIVGMVASFDHRKDFETLAKAAVSLCRLRKELIFLLIGDGPTRQPLINSIPEDLLNKQIFFPGRQDHVESILQIIDIGVLMTNASKHGEGVSNSIIEYMASKKPVIASRGGGTDEVIRDGVNGFLVDPKNEKDLTGRIELLVMDPDLRRKIGKNAYDWVRKHFDQRDKTQEYKNLYVRLLDVKAAK